jgi:type IV pilus assembly protein PilA
MEDGFTLVEMLVVVLIVAILAAIAVPSFLNQRSKAQDAEAKSMASTTAAALFIWHQEHDTFAGASIGDLAAIEPAVRIARNLDVDGQANRFVVSVDSAAGTSGGGPYVIEHDSGGTERTCMAPGRGACPSDGRW